MARGNAIHRCSYVLDPGSPQWPPIHWLETETSKARPTRPPNASPRHFFILWRSLLDLIPLVLSCCVCGVNKIDAPPGTTSRTRFWCRECSALVYVARHIASARDIPISTEWPLDLEKTVRIFGSGVIWGSKRGKVNACAASVPMDR
jgi:hypothetical protein